MFESNEIHFFGIFFWYFSATPVKINWVFTCGVDIELSGVDSRGRDLHCRPASTRGLDKNYFDGRVEWWGHLPMEEHSQRIRDKVHVSKISLTHQNLSILVEKLCALIPGGRARSDNCGCGEACQFRTILAAAHT